MGIMSNTWVRREYRVERVIGHCPNISRPSIVLGMFNHWHRVVGLTLAITYDGTTPYTHANVIYT